MQQFKLVKPPREQYGKRDLVQLHACPKCFAIHPEVLRKAAIFFLAGCEIDEGAKRRVRVACGQKPMALSTMSRVQTR